MHVMFYLVLSWLSTRKQKLFGIPCFLILCLVTWMIHCFFFVMVVHESLVCSEQLNWALFFRKNHPCPAYSSVFSIFCIFEPSKAVTVWFWDPSFHTEDNWGTQTQILKKFKHSLMLLKEPRCIKSRGWKLLNRMKIYFLILLKYIYIYIFHLVLHFRSNRRYLDVSRKTN